MKNHSKVLLVFLLTSGVSLSWASADDFSTDTNRVGAEAVISNGANGIGAEATAEGSGLSGREQIHPDYYSYSLSAGWAGSKPLGKIDYTLGHSDMRQTMMRGEATTHNARLDLVGVDGIAHPSSSSELRFYAGLYGAQYNWAIGGDGAWRALPVSLSFEQRFGRKGALKAEVAHAWLLSMSDDPLPDTKPYTVGKRSHFNNDDFEASIKGFYQATRNVAVSAGAVLEDSRYSTLKDGKTADPYYQNAGDCGVTATVGVNYAW